MSDPSFARAGRRRSVAHDRVDDGYRYLARRFVRVVQVRLDVERRFDLGSVLAGRESHGNHVHLLGGRGELERESLVGRFDGQHLERAFCVDDQFLGNLLARRDRAEEQ